jgi:multimeric flavodoxin WrbA
MGECFMGKNIVAVVGSYRSGKVNDALVSQIVRGAESQGARTSIICLRERNIEFCKNCRTCTQTPREVLRGECPINDDMSAICNELEAADAIVFASPINFGAVTALMKRFVERLVCYAYWPWASNRPPARRIRTRKKKALLVTSSAAPAPVTKLLMPGALRPMKWGAASLGAKVVGTVCAGMVPAQENPVLPQRKLDAAYRAGVKLARD